MTRLSELIHVSPTIESLNILSHRINDIQKERKKLLGFDSVQEMKPERSAEVKPPPMKEVLKFFRG